MPRSPVSRGEMVCVLATLDAQDGNRSRHKCAVRVALSALLLIGCVTAAFAQSAGRAAAVYSGGAFAPVAPPLSVPEGGPPKSPW